MKRCAVSVIDRTNFYDPALNFSFLGLTSPHDALDETPRIRNVFVKKHKKKYNSNSLFLNNNNLTDYIGLSRILTYYFVNPRNLAWLNLSFNNLSTIGEELTELPLLQILYLHGNLISRLDAVSKLKSLQKLRSLTLHGNPIELEKHYRSRILIHLPNLRSLDFSDVLSSDLFVAQRLEASLIRMAERKIY